MKSLNPLIIIYAIVLSLRIFGGPIIGLPQIVSVALTVLLVVRALAQGDVKITPLYYIYFIYLALALFVASPHPVFRSWERLLYFVIILLLISPVLENRLFRFIRYQTLKYLSIIIIFVALGSFVAYFLGINWMRARYDLDISNAGQFGGLTNQSMMLGPVAGISTCIFFQKFETYLEKKYLFYALITFITLLFSASRGALLATLAGISVLIYYNSKTRTFLYKRVVIILFTGLILSPFLIRASGGIMQKSQDVNRTGVFDSRTTKFLARLSEVENSPIYGIGFSAIDPSGNDEYDRKTGTIEPGSSVLAVVSMTGVIGLILLIFINIQAIRRLMESEFLYKNLILALITLFLIHMIVEGYIFAVTNPLSIYYWLLIGIANDSKFLALNRKTL